MRRKLNGTTHTLDGLNNVREPNQQAIALKKIAAAAMQWRTTLT
jgi:hypothetical protein